MSKKPYFVNPRHKEAGMVAIMVTLILMIVISLIVIGFAQISRRNQRQALDRQLSTQAFYAAETGINDASELIRAAILNGQSIAPKPDCDSDGGGFYTLNPVLDDANNVAYTCLMVNPTPPQLVYSSVGTTSTVVPLTASSGTLASVALTWQSKADTTTPATPCPASKSAAFSATSAWTCGYGVLRLDLVPTAGAALSLDSLRNNTMTMFVVPLRPGSSGDNGTTAYQAGGSKNVWGVVCSQTNCNLIINGLSASQYYLRVSSLYRDVSLQIVANDGSGSPVSLVGAQAVVDATGKAQDVLRRVQVRLPLTDSSTNLLSDYALQTTDAICKRFSVMDGFFQSYADAAVPGVGAGNPSNQLCQ